MAGTYDPNSEASDLEEAVTAHWELLRRNALFRAISEVWITSEAFRRIFVLTDHYHAQKRHTPRCAWAWMISGRQLAELAPLQIEKLKWFHDNRFNFGPFTVRQDLPSVAIATTPLSQLLKVEPLSSPPEPITVDVPWKDAPELFKQQYRLAFFPPQQLAPLNRELQENGDRLRRIAARIFRGASPEETRAFAAALFDFGSVLHDIAEFNNVFQIPNGRISEKRFNEHLDVIREAFDKQGLLIPTKKFDRHKSYMGTAEDWRWYLEAERLKLDITNSADALKLAQIYSEDLRARTMHSQAPPQSKPRGHTGDKFPAKTLKDRRRTPIRHVQTIQKWIRWVYPPGQRDPI